MKRFVHKGFTMIEIIIVIVLIGIIGSLAASMLFQGADIYVSETNRQSFVSEARSSFWKVMREAQGQASAVDFTDSDQMSLVLKNGKGDPIEYLTESPGDFKRRFNNGSYYELSNFLSDSESNGFTYLDNTYSSIIPSQSNGKLSANEAGNIHLIKLKLAFSKNEDNLSLSSYVYPHNFRFGKNMSYHNYSND